jgi:hypothetical protein
VTEQRTMETVNPAADDDVNDAERDETRSALTTADIAAGTKEASDRPMEATDRPMETTDRPMETTDRPMETTDRPVDATDRPVEPPAAPGSRATLAGATSGDAGAAVPFFDQRAVGELRERWDDVQVGFVDEPRTAVQRADELVAEAVKQLVDGFASQRQSLESQWSSGGEASTEDLRLALRRYRSFFDRLLSI